MRTTIILAALAAAISACAPLPDPSYGGYPGEPYPPASPYPPELPPIPPTLPDDESYRAIGTEPFWDLRIGRELVFTDRGTGLTVVQTTPRPIIGFAGEIYQTPRIHVNITHVKCSDGMSDRTYPDTAHVTVDGRDYRGCGAASTWFDSIDERGQPRPPAAGDDVPLDRTRWHILAVNGRPTPPDGDFTISFDSGRLSARFGCNGLGATYTQTGASVRAGPLIGTRMACPDMSFERQGSNILGQPLTIRLIEPDRITLAGTAGSIDLRRL